MDVSIVIPTKTVALFDEVLTMIDKQETEYEYEVICGILVQLMIRLKLIQTSSLYFKQIDKRNLAMATRNLEQV